MRRVLVIALLALCGCQTQQIEEMSYSERKALAEDITKRCYAQGVQPNSQQFNICAAAEVQREQAMRQNAAARQQRAMAGIGAGLANASASYNRAAMNTAARNRTTTCTRVPSPAGYATVRCY